MSREKQQYYECLKCGKTLNNKIDFIQVIEFPLVLCYECYKKWNPEKNKINKYLKF